jgi:ribosomal protein S2
MRKFVPFKKKPCLNNDCFVKELLLNAFFEKLAIKGLIQKSSFLGIRNQQIIFNVEKTILNYKKTFLLVRFFDFFKLQILFLGSPPLLEFFLKSLLLRTRHLFILNDAWLLGFLTNKRIFPSLIICFFKTLNFSSQESFKKHIPLVSFTDLSTNKNLFKKTDFMISLNTKSVLNVKLFFNFFKYLLSKKNGKR